MVWKTSFLGSGRNETIKFVIYLGIPIACGESRRTGRSLAQTPSSSVHKTSQQTLNDNTHTYPSDSRRL
jgi:hypothetical protein